MTQAMQNDRHDDGAGEPDAERVERRGPDRPFTQGPPDGGDMPKPGDTPVGAMHGRLREALASGAFAGSDGALLGVPVTMRAVLGEARVPVSQFLALEAGDTLPLNRLVGEPIDVTVNDAVIARGEIVMLDEDTGRLGVRVVSLSGAI